MSLLCLTCHSVCLHHHLAVGTTRRPTQHGFSGTPVRFLSLMWERRASLEKTLSLSLFCSLSRFPSLVFFYPSLARHTLFHLPPLAHALVLALVLALALSMCDCVCMTLSYTHTLYHAGSCTISLSLCLARSLSIACVVSVAQTEETVPMFARWGI